MAKIGSNVLDITDVRTVVLRKMEEMIVTGQISANKKIQEQDIAEALGVSRTPVRDALHRLEETGIVERIPRRGTFIRKINTNEVEEIYTIRALLEGNAARRAAEKRTREDLETLWRMVEEMSQAQQAEDMRQLVMLNERFHGRIANFAGPLTKKLVSRFSVRISRYRAAAMTFDRRDEEAVREHIAILRAIEAASPDDAEQEIVRHTNNGLKAIKNLLQYSDPELFNEGFIERCLRSIEFDVEQDRT